MPADPPFQLPEMPPENHRKCPSESRWSSTPAGDPAAQGGLTPVRPRCHCSRPHPDCHDASPNRRQSRCAHPSEPVLILRPAENRSKVPRKLPKPAPPNVLGPPYRKRPFRISLVQHSSEQLRPIIRVKELAITCQDESPVCSVLCRRHVKPSPRARGKPKTVNDPSRCLGLNNASSRGY